MNRSASPKNLATPLPLARKRAALRLLRAREACGISQEQLAAELGISKRAYGSIERGQVRAIGLEALVYLLELIEGGSHAAPLAKAGAQSGQLRSHQTNLSVSGGHGARICAANDSVSGGGANAALMPIDRNSSEVSTLAAPSSLQGRAARSALRVHTAEVASSNLAPATKRRAA